MSALVGYISLSTSSVHLGSNSGRIGSDRLVDGKEGVKSLESAR